MMRVVLEFRKFKLPANIEYISILVVKKTRGKSKARRVFSSGGDA
jgi:hypothetical protein